MMSSSRDVLLKLSETTSPPKLFQSDCACITLYSRKERKDGIIKICTGICRMSQKRANPGRPAHVGFPQVH